MRQPTPLGLLRRSNRACWRGAGKNGTNRPIGVLVRSTDLISPSSSRVPVLNNQRSWFFRYADKRGAGDIDALWRIFAAAQALVEDDGPGTRDEFIEAYDAARKVWAGIGY